MRALQIDGTITTYERVESFDAAKALIQRIVPDAGPADIWIQRVAVDHYDITKFGEELPNYIQGQFSVTFKAGLLSDKEGTA